MAQNVVEVVVRQQNIANLAAGERHRVLGDRPGLGQSRTRVDEQDLTTTVDKPNRDVTERQPAAEHVLPKPLPREIQRSGHHLCEATPADTVRECAPLSRGPAARYGEVESSTTDRERTP